VARLGEEFQHKMLAGIMAFELESSAGRAS
jgi:hypothetical protein